MRAASSSGGHTASSLPFKFLQHLRDFRMVLTALLVLPSTERRGSSLGDAERWALARVDDETGMWICTLLVSLC